MTHYKDFFGDTLDDAIKEACDYFGIAREKLEIEIVNDAKSGIFGLVGKKQAQIRAARVQLDSAAEHDSPAGAEVPSLPPKGDAGAAKRPQATPSPPQSQTGRPDDTAKTSVSQPEAGQTGGTDAALPPQADASPAPEAKALPRSHSRNGKNPAPKPRPGGGKERRRDDPAENHGLAGRYGDRKPQAADEHPGHDTPEFNLETGDRELLFATVRTVVQRLVEPIVGSVDCRVEIHGKRVRATVDCGDASPLLVGRDGQTLAAVQYLASRMVGRQLGGMVRLNIDAGRYRERQDDKLKELTFSLAEEVRKTGRPQSTKPLSAYQRRIVHLALEADPDLETRSKGEGSQRRVIIQLKKDAPEQNGPKQNGKDAARPDSGQTAPFASLDTPQADHQDTPPASQEATTQSAPQDAPEPASRDTATLSAPQSAPQDTTDAGSDE